MESHPTFDVPEFFNGFRRHSIFTFIICFLCFTFELSFGQIKDSDKKFIICHHLPDNPDKTITLEVGIDDLQEHLDHGDTFGPCFNGDLSGDILPYFEPLYGKVEEEIGAALTSLVEQFKILGSVPSDDIYIVSGDRVLIEIIAESISAVTTIEAYISITYPDAIIYTDFGQEDDDLIITVLFPIDNLIDLNEDLYQQYNVISFARPVYTPVLKSGTVTSQGDLSIQADNARKAFESVDGTGVKVCVISDSYNAKQKAQADIDNKELPPFVDVAEDFPSDFGAHFYVVDEGRAMLQIIHDIAPGATLGFQTGFKGIEQMADGIQTLKTNHNCKVIVDDVTHLAEPFFTDGLISRAVDKVSGEGVIYFSAAGNFKDWGYESQFTPAYENETFHSFSGDGNIYQEVRFEKAGVYIFVLQWDDIYKSLGPDGNTGAKNDLDISLLDVNGNTLVNLNCNNTGGDPVEVMPIRVENAGALANLVIEKGPDDQNVNFKYIVFVGGNDFTILSEASSVSTIVGQANASAAYTVGAAFYDQSPAYGVNAPIIEPFSSYGGNQINGIDRHKPDFIGPDAVNTSVFSIGLDIDQDLDIFPNFLGTSAAAPHAAAVSALISHAATKFEVTGIAIGETMKQTALDMYQPGYDPLSGSGFILADEAIISFATPKPTITELVVPDNKIPGDKAFVATIKGENLTATSQVLFNGNPLDAKDVIFVDRTTITAKIPSFTDDPPVQIYNPFITPSELDGGYSNELSFFSIPKKKIAVIADAKTKKFGEKNPEFTATLLVDGLPLAESGLDPTEINRLSSIGFLFETASKQWDDTEGQYCSTTGIYYIHPIGIDPEYIASDPMIVEDYEFEYAVDDKAGYLTIEKLPITIKPITKESYVYGESFQDIFFEYDLYSDGTENNEDIDDLELLLEYIRLEHQSTFREEVTNAIVDRARQLVNRGRQLVNESAWLVSDAALSNRARQLVNGDISIDLDIDLLTNYVDPLTGEIINPDGTIPNRGRQLVNGEFFYNGGAYIKDELGNRARQLVNEGAVGSIESEGEDFADIILIVDATDATISNMYSINLISGLDVNPIEGDPNYEGAPQYCVPGAFISSASDNFIITYSSAEFNVLPATLSMSADDKWIINGDPLPEFSSSFIGLQYNDNPQDIFENISYTTGDYNEIGLYDIIPQSFTFIEPSNYSLEESNINSGTLQVFDENELKFIVASDKVKSIDLSGNLNDLIDTESRDIEMLENNIFVKGSDPQILTYNLNGDFIRSIPFPSEVINHGNFNVLPNSNFAIYDNRNDKVYIINSQGEYLTSVTISETPDNQLQFLDGVVVDNALIVAEDGHKNIIKINLDSYEVSIFREFPHLPGGLGVIDHYNGTYYLCRADEILAFKEYDPTITSLAAVPETNFYANGILVAGNFAYITKSYSQNLYKIDLTTGSSEIFKDGLLALNDIEILFPKPTADVWILSDSDPDNVNPPFDDYLLSYNSNENLILEKSGFNTQITITGNEYVKVNEQGDYAWIVENVNHNLTKISSTGDVLATPNPSIMYGRMYMTSDERLYILEYTGDKFGSNVHILDNDGTILRSEAFGGTSIVVDESHSTVWIAGADLNKYDLNLQEQTLIADPLIGTAFSMDFDADGNLWIGEHVDGGDDRLLYISSIGELLDFQILPSDVVCVKVNKMDGKVWYITGDGLSYFDPNSLSTDYVGDHFWSFDIDYYNNAVWASKMGEIYKYAFDGAFLSSISNSNVSNYNIIGARSYFGSFTAGARMVSDPLSGSKIVDGNVTLYPNPVINWLTIEFTDQSVVLGKVSIAVYNDQPSIVPVNAIGSPTVYGFEVDFNSLIPGTYYLQLYDGIEVRVFRLIKE